MQHRKRWQKNVKKLNIGDQLQLLPDPTNPYDKNAVGILNSNNALLGYVPRSTIDPPSLTGKKIAGLIKKGKILCCEVVDVQYKVDPWEALLVEVRAV